MIMAQPVLIPNTEANKLAPGLVGAGKRVVCDMPLATGVLFLASLLD